MVWLSILQFCILFLRTEPLDVSNLQDEKHAAKAGTTSGRCGFVEFRVLSRDVLMALKPDSFFILFVNLF